MKIRCSKNELVTAINRVQGALSEKNLAHIGLRADCGKLKVTASDRVLSIFCLSSYGSGEEEGTIFVPSKLFTDVVKELPSGETLLETSGSSLTISAGDDRQFFMKLPLITEASWSEPQISSELQVISLPKVQLSYMIEQVQFCISQESQRNYGSVAYMHKVDSSTLRLVGTDGFRLSYCDMSVSLPDDFLEQGICISKRALQELHKVCSEAEDSIEFGLTSDGSILKASVKDYEIYVLLSSVKYPNYQGVIPNSHPHSLCADRSSIQSIVKRVLLAADKTRALQLLFSSNRLTFSSKTMGSSEGRENVSLESYEGPKGSFSVNGKYFSDVLSNTISQKVNIHFKDDEMPVMIVPESESKGCRSKHVLVPIREH